MPAEPGFSLPVGSADAALVVDVDGFEGPLDLLLELARRQKVDLARMSILALADQYLAFIDAARARRLELAADYLLMAAWLAYLKSRLLLPEAPRAEEPSAADLATALAQRLKRLDQIRIAARWLDARPQLGRDVFGRGCRPDHEGGADEPFVATLHNLLSAYARQRQRQMPAAVLVAARQVWSLAEARQALTRLVGLAETWLEVDRYLLDYAVEPAAHATVRASALSAMLEMVREGQAELRQDGAFQPLYLRRRVPVGEQGSGQGSRPASAPLRERPEGHGPGGAEA